MIGEDAHLGDLRVTSRAVVFFPDPPENLYQIRQWYQSLRELDKRMGVTLITQDSRTGRALRAETDLNVLVVATTRTVAQLVARGDARIAIYVGHANANAVCQRSTHVAHVFLAHGDSDKSVSVSNQVKGFDFTLVAGQAAVERYRSTVLFFDAETRLRIIGRPQLPDQSERSGPTTILYAPTWEGSQEANAYSSVKDFGYAIIDSLLRDSDVQVIYRPHPRTGASDRTYRDADARIRALVAAHPRRASTDTTTDGGAALQRADLLISDISAMCSDWLSQCRPIIITVPKAELAVPTMPSRLVRVVPRIGESEAFDTVRIVRAALADDQLTERIASLRDYYLGGLTGDEAMERFLDTCEEIAAERDREFAAKELPHVR